MNGATQEAGADLQQIMLRVRELPPVDRARLVGMVLASLDEPDPAIEEAWRHEVERRAEGMDDGSRTATAWTDARKTLGL